MRHKRKGQEKTKEFKELFMSLDENGQDEALDILYSLSENQSNALHSDLKPQREGPTVQ